jgi:hypothetical protein
MNDMLNPPDSAGKRRGGEERKRGALTAGERERGVDSRKERDTHFPRYSTHPPLL